MRSRGGNWSLFSADGFDNVGAISLLRRNSAVGHLGVGVALRGAQNVATKTVALGNQTLDLSDTSGCQNLWSENLFASSDAACIH